MPRLRAPGPLRAGTGRRGADRRAAEPEAGPRRRPLVLTDRQQRRLIEGARKRGAGAVVGRGTHAELLECCPTFGEIGGSQQAWAEAARKPRR